MQASATPAWAPILAVFLALSGCASEPVAPGPALANGRDGVELSAHRSPRGGSGWTVGDTDFPPIEATCTATNDAGTWTLQTPGRLEVVPSHSTLKVTCRSEGFHDAELSLKCITPRMLRSAGAARGAAALMMFVPPVALVGLPVLLVAGGVAASGAAVGAALPGGPGADDCTYFSSLQSVHLWMKPKD